MNKERMKVYSIKIIMPYWLKWAKRFITLKTTMHNTKSDLRGQEFDAVIIYEVVKL